jgi:hypothetical protein
MGLLIPSLGSVYALVGAICSTCIAYFLPGVSALIIFIRLRRDPWLSVNTRSKLAHQLSEETVTITTDARPRRTPRSTIATTSQRITNDVEETTALLSTDDSIRQSRTEIPWMYLAICLVLCVFGIFALMAGSISTILEMVKQ